jgi:hypothetical protein
MHTKVTSDTQSIKITSQIRMQKWERKIEKWYNTTDYITLPMLLLLKIQNSSILSHTTFHYSIVFKLYMPSNACLYLTSNITDISMFLPVCRIHDQNYFNSTSHNDVVSVWSEKMYKMRILVTVIQCATRWCTYAFHN